MAKPQEFVKGHTIMPVSADGSRQVLARPSPAGTRSKSIVVEHWFPTAEVFVIVFVAKVGDEARFVRRRVVRGLDHSLEHWQQTVAVVAIEAWCARWLSP